MTIHLSTLNLEHHCASEGTKLGHYWELSYDIFDRIEVSVENRISYVNYMMENRLIARRKKVNSKGLVTQNTSISSLEAFNQLLL